MRTRSFLLLCSVLLPLVSFGWSGGYHSEVRSSAVAMSDTMARNTMICIGVAVFIVFLYGVKYWNKKKRW